MEGLYRPLDLVHEISTLGLIRELSNAQELHDADGYVDEFAAQSALQIANQHLDTVDEPRDVWMMSDQVLHIPQDSIDIAFMRDEDALRAVRQETTAMRGYFYSVQYLASIAFSGFGVRLCGVNVVAPENERLNTLFVPVEDIRVSVAAS